MPAPTDQLEPFVAELIRLRRPGFALQQRFYTSPQIFERDMQRVYMRYWLFAGHISRIPEPGDYFTYEVAGESIILIRGAGGKIHGLFNVCRHRGSRLCLEEAGSAKHLVCPYHAWTYGHDGTLLAARGLPDHVDVAELGLSRCHVRIIEGLIFICLGDDPPDLDNVARDIVTFFKPHGLTQAKICQRSRHTIRANWKVVLENFWECYHCGPAHPELGRVMSYVRAVDSPRAAERWAGDIEKWEARTDLMGHRIGRAGDPRGLNHEVVRIPIRDGFVTQSSDGKPVAPLMGDFNEYDGGVTAIQWYPLNWFVACNDHAMLSRFTPVSPTETEGELTWLVHEDAVEGVDYNPDEVTWLWRKTMEQDVTLCENAQMGINSRHYRPGPYSKSEQSVEKLIQWYLEQIA